MYTVKNRMLQMDAGGFNYWYPIEFRCVETYVIVKS